MCIDLREIMINMIIGPLYTYHHIHLTCRHASFLADCTNGCAYTTELHWCVRLSLYVCL